MSSIIAKPKKLIRTSTKVKPMTKYEMLQKMIADQQLIRECRKKGMTYQQISTQYGFQFKTV